AGALPALVAACGDDDEGGSGASRRTAAAEGEPIVADVLDFALSSDEWEGAFGFVSIRLHRGLVEGRECWYIRTDTSDEGFARGEGLVFAPKLGGLASSRGTGDFYLVEGGVEGQPALLSAAPGEQGYTPAWLLHRARWQAQPRQLASIAELERAEEAGDVRIERSRIVLNAPIVKAPSSQIGVDQRLRAYLEGGQLIEEPDTRGQEVKFKLHECFPNARYIVCDHSIAPAAEMTRTLFSPGLHGAPRRAGATGRTNVFMNGIPGPGPMEHQPSVFDSDPGDPQWSPYWDHFAYEWRKGRKPRVLRTERQVHAARDAGELLEHPGTPDTRGEVFTVNCPVPVTAPATFRA
ncbi:MAG: DUF7482 domain-containing protein, partial [Thermoleophilaceae bacterium]